MAPQYIFAPFIVLIGVLVGVIFVMAFNSKGSEGPVGEPGLRGEPGKQGPTGSVVSVSGPRGPIGPIGPRGHVGPMGPQGSSGPKGTAATFQQFTANATGPTGPISASLSGGSEPNSYNLALTVPVLSSIGVGASFTVTGPTFGSANVVQSSTASGYFNQFSFAIPQGPTGAQGQPAKDGVDGQPGPQGPQGVVGPTGPTGPIGNMNAVNYLMNVTNTAVQQSYSCNKNSTVYCMGSNACAPPLGPNPLSQSGVGDAFAWDGITPLLVVLQGSPSGPTYSPGATPAFTIQLPTDFNSNTSYYGRALARLVLYTNNSCPANSYLTVNLLIGSGSNSQQTLQRPVIDALNFDVLMIANRYYEIEIMCISNTIFFSKCLQGNANAYNGFSAQGVSQNYPGVNATWSVYKTITDMVPATS